MRLISDNHIEQIKRRELKKSFECVRYFFAHLLELTLEN